MGCTGTEIGYLAFYNMQISSFPQGRILYNCFTIQYIRQKRRTMSERRLCYRLMRIMNQQGNENEFH